MPQKGEKGSFCFAKAMLTTMKKEKVKDKGLSNAVSGSLVLPFLYRIAKWLYRGVAESAVGRYFTGYAKRETDMREGLIGSTLCRLQPGARFLRPMRHKIAAQFDNSAILNRIRLQLDRLAGLSMSVYGLVFLFYSFFSSVICILRYLSPEEGAFRAGMSPADLVIAGGALLAGIFCVASRSYLSRAICESRLAHFLLFTCLGAKEAYFRSVAPYRGHASHAVLLGAVLGLATAVVPPLYLCIGIIGMILAFAVYKIPEAGVALLMMTAPLLPTMILVALTMYTGVCYALKFLRGKRIFTVEWLDVCVLAFAAVMLCAGVFSASPSDSLFPTMVYVCFLCAYFPVVNLIRSEDWVTRCTFAVTASAVLVALYGIYQNFFGVADRTWQDTTMFSEISGRVVSTLENPNVLAEYLIMCLPLPIARALTEERISSRLMALFSAGVIGACLIFTWSRGAWLGFLIAMLLFMLMFSKKTLVALLLGVVAIPFLPFVLPQSILNRFLSIGNLGDTSTSYRVHIWEGSLNLLSDHFLFGIGVGGGVFSKVYPRYALSGIEQAPHSHNLYLQIFVECGIFGLLLFLCMLLVWAKHAFTSFTGNGPKKMKLMMAAVFCGMLAVLAQGMTDYIWYNYRVTLFFWLMFGFAVAIARTMKAEHRIPSDHFFDPTMGGMHGEKRMSE